MQAQPTYPNGWMSWLTCRDSGVNRFHSNAPMMENTDSEDRMMAAKVGLDACFCPQNLERKADADRQDTAEQDGTERPRKPLCRDFPALYDQSCRKVQHPGDQELPGRESQDADIPHQSVYCRMCAAQTARPAAGIPRPRQTEGPSPPLAHRRYRPSTARPTPTPCIPRGLAVKYKK